MPGADDPPRFRGAAASDPRRSQPGLADSHHQPGRRRSRHDTPERRPRVAARPQTFDVGALLPRDLQPTGFHDLNDKADEIMQYLMSVEGMSGIEAQRYLREIEGDMIAQAG